MEKYDIINPIFERYHMKKTITALLAILSLQTHLFADKNNCIRQPEPWYHYFEAGTKIQAWDGRKRFSTRGLFSITPVIYYKPLDRNTLLGFGGNLDILKGDGDNLSDISFSMGASAQFYVNRIGDGFFFKADLGLAKHIIFEEDIDPYELVSFEYKIGAGYALPLNRKTSLIGLFYYRSFFHFDRETMLYELNFSLGLLL